MRPQNRSGATDQTNGVHFRGVSVVSLETIRMSRPKKILTGRYSRINEVFLRVRAGRHADSRHVFYVAMLANDTYEAYEAAIQDIEVSAPTYRTGPINGHMEMLYARRNGWIVDYEDG